MIDLYFSDGFIQVGSLFGLLFFEGLSDCLHISNSFTEFFRFSAKSRLAQHLKEIFEDVCEYGMVDVFVDDCIEVGFCVEPKALMQAGLSPKSSHEVSRFLVRV